MNVITLRDYAKQNNISYEAVRKQLVRYKDELGDHIIRDGRQQFLDEEAVAFLDEKRQKNPVAIIQQDKDEQIEALKTELNLAKNIIIELQDERNKLKDEKHALELENAKIALLEADNASKDKKIEEAEKMAENANLRLTEVHESFEQELKEQDKRVEAAEAYAAELEAYLKERDEYDRLPFYKRWKTVKPTKPILKEQSLEDEDKE